MVPATVVSYSNRSRSAQVITILAASAVVAYAYAFCSVVSGQWFNPDWSTDDSMQQVYPFYKVLYPKLFEGDLITRMMECYLAPLHYWISWGVTWLTGDPLMMGHWVMLLQVLGAMAFMFLAVRHAAGTVPALFSVLWLLHTRHVMQRMTGGLPRGWSPTVLGAFLYFAVSGNHWGVIATLLVGCLIHTPSTLIAALAYGLFLLWSVLRKETRAQYKKHFIRYVLVSPLCAALALSVVEMPADIGTMATLERAAQMPEFQRPGGRFPFVPLNPAEKEIRSFGFQAFIGRFYQPPRIVERRMPEIVLSLLAVLALIGAARKIKVVPPVVWWFGLSAMIVYFASRILAFRLYVPDRHLQIPLAMFFITAFSIGAWRAFAPKEIVPLGVQKWSAAPAFAQSWKSLLGIFAVGVVVCLGSGDGLSGLMNFNTWRTKRGEVWTWIKDHTPQDAIIAGHPTWIDPVMLYGARQGFVTTETAHPFYDKYYAEMKRRTEIALKLHFARDWKEVLSLSQAEGIDYVVFQRAAFRPLALSRTKYFPPFGDIVAEVRARPLDQFAYFSLPEAPESEAFPALVFADRSSKVVSVERLAAMLGNH